MSDETLTLTGELLEMDDDEIDLEERLDTGTERSVDNEDDHLPEATLGTGEAGEITNVRYPVSARKGQEIAVLTDVKNTGDKTCEFRVYLKNPEGKTIDKEPDTYKSVAPGETATIKTSTEWDARWAMPGYDWNLRLVLYDIDLLNWKDRLDERNFTVKLGGDAPPAPPGPVCDEGEVVGDMICRGGVYVPISPDSGPCSPEGAYDATGTQICSGGVWVPVGEEPGTGCTVEGAYSADGTEICRGGVWMPVGEEPGVPGVSKYLTVAEADDRVRAGLPCYIKCVLPILDMLPGLPYFVGCPILPGFAITEKP